MQKRQKSLIYGILYYFHTYYIDEYHNLSSDDKKSLIFYIVFNFLFLSSVFATLYRTHSLSIIEFAINANKTKKFNLMQLSLH